MGSLPNPEPFRVLIAGGSYGGLAVAVNLLDLTRGLPARSGPKPAEGDNEFQTPRPPQPQIPVDITIVDERDGFCQSIRSYRSQASRGRGMKN